MSRKVKSANPFLIGLFVIIGSLIMIGLIIWLGASQILKQQRYYVTYFDTSVEGLDKGSAVKYQGVPCGRITEIQVAPDGKLVEVVFQIDVTIKIDDSLRVQPAMAGIAGGKFLQLHYPSNPDMASKFPDLQFEPNYTLIRSAPSGLEEMTIAAQAVMNNLMQLNVYELNKKTIEFLTESTRFFTKKELDEILKNLESSTVHLNEVMEKANNSNAIDNINETSAILRKSALRVEDMIAEMNSQVEQMQLHTYMEKFYLKYDSSLTRTTDIIANMGYRTESSVYSMQELMEQLIRTNHDLRNVLRSFNDNPSSMIFSLPPPPEE
ncbi:MAG: MlaD family protein [Candidatus Kapaibacterium sp.]|jgi:phospholipid/cholesterol/gamma-HCH transport system substrate-binding protein|nr:MlaD family protein [Candidatus Kapabacteria bacterium]